MCKLQIKNRRESTMVRDNEIHKIHKEILAASVKIVYRHVKLYPSYYLPLNWLNNLSAAS